MISKDVWQHRTGCFLLSWQYIFFCVCLCMHLLPWVPLCSLSLFICMFLAAPCACLLSTCMYLFVFECTYLLTVCICCLCICLLSVYLSAFLCIKLLSVCRYLLSYVPICFCQNVCTPIYAVCLLSCFACVCLCVCPLSDCILSVSLTPILFLGLSVSPCHSSLPLILSLPLPLTLFRTHIN